MMFRVHCVTLLAVLLPTVAAQPSRAESPGEAAEFFERQVRPVLAEQCFKCHSNQAKKLQAGLKADSRQSLLVGGDTGPAIVPGKPDDSLLVQAVRYDDVGLQMPPHGKLPAEQIAALTKWVAIGAPWPAEKLPAQKLPAGEVSTTGKAATRPAFDLQARKRSHWAWQPIRVTAAPSVRDARWPAGDVDRFILARLEAAGLRPAPPAERAKLLRRLHFDLTGLPPTPQEIAEFLADTSPEAYEHLVDRLLASPQFGEHWARHWLDLVRYGESRGHEFDYTIPNAWQYRDYVIRAFNADVPYDQFVREHVAGDLLPRPRLHSTAGFNESILGTGFWFLGEWVHSPVDTRKDETDRFDNEVDTFSKTFLGLTVACARCHDHKFDAISTDDYYALFGFLRSSRFRLAAFDVEAANQHVAERLAQAANRQQPMVRRAVARALRPQLERMADYLLAAREALAAVKPNSLAHADKKTGSKHVQLSEAYRAEVATIAGVHGVEGERLARWVEALLAARSNAADPLHVWARACSDRSTDDPQRWSELVDRTLSDWHKQQATSAAAMQSVRTIVDYAHCDARDYLQDGFAFGLRPASPGEIVVTGSRARPSVEVATCGAALSDPSWDVLRLAPGVENESGRLEKWVRAGRTLQTRSFRLASSDVYYLLRGKCHVYAEVDSHRMNNGPLHAKMIASFDAGEQFRWVRHNLTAYRGRSVHIEFTPDGEHGFALAGIVEADRLPPLPGDNPNTILAALLERDGASPAALALAMEKLFTTLVHEWAGDALSSDAADAARLIDWVSHSGLFSPSGDPWKSATAAWLAERQRLAAEIKPQMHLAMAMMDGTPEDERVLVRGNSTSPGKIVPRRFLEALAGPNQRPISSGSGRLELAQRTLDPANPLLSRVIVNRLWQHLFGRGIVASVDNFGVLGERPTHPELLDWLADHLRRDGWSLKRMIKLLVMSETYRMSSRAANAHALAADPNNSLWHRMPLKRLEAESIRDSILAVAGSLKLEQGGPSVPVYLTEFLTGRGRPASGPLDGAGRRSIYIAVRRNFMPPMMTVFDTPIPFATLGRRSVSNVPAQALMMMNDPLVVAQAKGWAQKLSAETSAGPERLARVYLAALGRQPAADEQKLALRFVAEQQTHYARTEGGRAEAHAWADLCHMVFNLKEFIFVE